MIAEYLTARWMQTSIDDVARRHRENTMPIRADHDGTLWAIRLELDDFFLGRRPGFAQRLMFRADGEAVKTTDGKTVWTAATLKHHGVTKIEIVSYLRETGGGCDLCKREFSIDGVASRPHIDHDHEDAITLSKRTVRGILCVSCNTALGQFSDDVSLLRAAMDYLERPPFQHRKR